MVVLSVFTTATLSRASNVLAIGFNTNSPALKLFSISTNESREIAEFKGQVWYGSDEDSFACLQVGNEQGRGIRLLVLDRKTLAVVMDKVFTNTHAWPIKMPAGNELAVRSKDSTVYFNGYEMLADGKIHFCYEEVNWKTGEAHPVPSTPAAGVMYAKPLALPEGFASIGYTRRMALYTETTRRELPLSATNGWADRNVYFVPTIGLMEFYGGCHRQLTDGKLSIIDEPPVLFSNTNISSGIFVRNNNGKSFLIWGENNSPSSKSIPSSAVTEIVIFDPVTKKEVLRKQLGGKFGNLEPDRAGAKIYFVKPDSKEIYCFDRETGMINLFAKTELVNFNGWNCAIVLAN